MVLESLVVSMCINVGHCDSLVRHYFYYNPIVENQLKNNAQLYESKAKNVFGEKFMNGVVPLIGLVTKREATIGFPNNQSITLRLNDTKIGVTYSYNF